MQRPGGVPRIAGRLAMSRAMGDAKVRGSFMQRIQASCNEGKCRSAAEWGSGEVGPPVAGYAEQPS